MKYAIIKDGKVENIINATEDFASSIGAIPCNESVNIGDEYVNGQFVKINSPLNFFPIKPAYIRIALNQFGLLTAIEEALSQPQFVNEKIYYEYALEFKRDDAIINSFAQAFGMTDSQVDQIFLYAQSIQQ